MEINWLKDFLTLNVEGNFRVAAQLRGVSQPAFSRRIQALEAWIGAPLIDRSTHPSQLTGSGKMFLPVAQNIVEMAEASKQDIQQQIEEDKERMSFATTSSLAQIFIPGWLGSVQSLIETNQFVVKTEYDLISDYFAAVEDNAVDFFIGYEDTTHRLSVDKAVFGVLNLGFETLIPVASAKPTGAPLWWLPDQSKQPIPCLHTLSARTPSPIRQHMQSSYSRNKFKSVYESSIAPTLKAMAIEGFGLAWIPSAHIIDELASGKLVRAGNAEDEINVDINIYRCLKYNEPRVEKFWKVLLNQQVNP